MRVVCQSIPIFICWEIWNTWSSIKYDQKRYSVGKICYEVSQHLIRFRNNKGYKMNTNYNWSSICKAMESYKAKLSSKPITWNKPPENIIKVKTDDFNDTRDSILEVDSMMVVKWLERAYIVPWDLEYEVIQHCFREANTVADALAKFGNKSPDNLIANMFISLQELPHEARRPIRMDKAQLANFRIRHK
ncbi:hypothetical protein R3W88_011395 [Solanum pinnatisectum]|uniref:RNase H type-1 domain-containing protein n=1 Tax=Solanum pinnatisectum TaxID=50273 RepID=A0AAV9L624_9SOLN|nr:hypothetical protein R3W88_011395 [Solanum pinnatisectum]